MTKQTNQKPQSLDEYFERAKEAKNGMSAKQVSDLISSAPAAKLSWLAYMKPLASKINSILLVSVLAVVTYLSVDVDDLGDDKQNFALSSENQQQKLVITNEQESNYLQNSVNQESNEAAAKDLLSYAASSEKNTVNISNTSHSDLLPKHAVEDKDLIANNSLIVPSTVVIVQNEYTYNHKIEYVPFKMDTPEEQAIPEEEDLETFETFAGKDAKNMYYLQVDAKFTKTSINDAVLAGGKIAWMPSDYMSFGFAGYGMTNKPIVQIMNKDQMVDGHLYVGYGGFFMEYYLFPREIFHGYIGSFFGLGGVRADPVEGNTSQNQSINNSMFWIIEPNIGIELNVTSFLKLGLDVSYRHSEFSGSDKVFAQSSDLTNFKFSGLSTGIYLKLGLY